MRKIIIAIIFMLVCFCAQSQDTLKVSQDTLEAKDESLKERDKKAKSLSPVPGKAIVYIIRPTAYGFLVKMKLYCDTVFLGSTMAERYVYTIVDPGKYNFISKSENKFNFELTVEPGKIYYLKQQVKMGMLYASTKLKLLSEEEGKRYLLKTKLSKDNTYVE